MFMQNMLCQKVERDSMPDDQLKLAIKKRFM